jgi:hypothetical protein
VNQQQQQLAKKSTATSKLSSDAVDNNNLLSDWHDVISIPHAAFRRPRPPTSKDEPRPLTKIVFYAFKNLHQVTLLL